MQVSLQNKDGVNRDTPVDGRNMFHVDSTFPPLPSSSWQQELGEQKVSNAELRRSLDVLREAIQPLLPRGQTLPTM